MRILTCVSYVLILLAGQTRFVYVVKAEKSKSSNGKRFLLTKENNLLIILILCTISVG